MFIGKTKHIFFHTSTPYQKSSCKPNYLGSHEFLQFLKSYIFNYNIPLPNYPTLIYSAHSSRNKSLPSVL